MNLCSIGVAIGDALGAAVKFKMPGNFAPVVGYRANGAHELRPSECSDDTRMALAMADSIANAGWSLRYQTQGCVRWWRNGECSGNDPCFDIGIMTLAAMARIQQTGDALPSGDPWKRASGNGLLMRLAPRPNIDIDV